MLVFYIFIILVVLIFLVWRRKWKTLIGFVVVIGVGGYLFMRFVSAAFGEKCEDKRVWKIENYVLVEKRCLGFAGPPYYPVYLYKDNKKIDRLSYVLDSDCLLKFKPETGDTLTFDICKLQVTGKK